MADWCGQTVRQSRLWSEVPALVISSLPPQETAVTSQRPWRAAATMAGSAPPRQLGSQEGSDRLGAWALRPRPSPHAKNTLEALLTCSGGETSSASGRGGAESRCSRHWDPPLRGRPPANGRLLHQVRSADAERERGQAELRRQLQLPPARPPPHPHLLEGRTPGSSGARSFSKNTPCSLSLFLLQPPAEEMRS